MAHALRKNRLALDVPMDLEAYFAAEEENQLLQDELDALLRDLHCDPQTLPSAQQIQTMLERYIPYEDSLANLVTTMREE